MTVIGEMSGNMTVTSDIAAWIVSAGLRGEPEKELVKGLCEHLVNAGVPLLRCQIGQRTLHPVFGAHMFLWTSDEEVIRQTDWGRAEVESGEGWKQDPFYYMLDTRTPRLRHRLDESNRPFEFPLFDDLRSLGATDYLAAATAFGKAGRLGAGGGLLSSWVCNASDGFSEDHIEMIEQLLPSFALSMKGASTYRIATSVIETYLGKDAGRKVLSGEIERGSVETISAVLWYCDLQGFTNIADTAPRDHLIAMLNEYFECMAAPVHERGGEVLKFMGDGLLAIFKLEDGSHVCGSALDAAEDAFARVSIVNAARAKSGLPVTKFKLGLHLGDVMYGNIGSRDRLDFTVIGPAVNEVSRIEAMCRGLDQDIIASAAFAAGDEKCTARLVSLGRYVLRGVRKPQELFTLPSEGGAENVPQEAG